MALGVAALCGIYNAAAWLSRRERHLAVNAVLYAALVVFERRHVAHHLAGLRRSRATQDAVPTLPIVEVAPVVAAATPAAAAIAA
jgi:hypothetical protein